MEKVTLTEAWFAGPFAAAHRARPRGVSQAYLRLVDQRRVKWQNRAHFFVIAAHTMRRILLDHARAHDAIERGAGARVPLQEGDAATGPFEMDSADRERSAW